MTTAKKRKKPAKKRVRCKYRKGDVLDHRILGRIEVVATKKVGPRRFTVTVDYAGGSMFMTVSDENLNLNAKKLDKAS